MIAAITADRLAICRQARQQPMGARQTTGDGQGRLQFVDDGNQSRRLQHLERYQSS